MSKAINSFSQFLSGGGHGEYFVKDGYKVFAGTKEVCMVRCESQDVFVVYADGDGIGDSEENISTAGTISVYKEVDIQL